MFSSGNRVLSLHYGAGVQEAVLPPNWNVHMPEGASRNVKRPGHEVVLEALARPIAAPPLRESVHGNSIVILVPDKTRRAATDVVLPTLLNELACAGIDDDQITIMFATGTHAAQTGEERKQLLGEEVFRRFRIEEHDARDASACVLLGETRFGTPVLLNRRVVEADFVLVAGTVVHHYFAGFGGGAKMFLPGVAAYETATTNHRRTITAEGGFHTACRDGNVFGNPVMDDILDAVRFFPPCWYFAAILDEGGDIAAAVCGDLLAAHQAGCEIVDTLFTEHVGRRSEVCIASAGGYPKDINLIQSHKAIHHAHYAVADGGTLICVAECREGIGNSRFLDWFRYADATAFRDALLTRYSMNAHTALSLREKTEKMRIILVSSINQEVVQLMGMEHASSLEAAVAMAAGPADAYVYAIVLPNASLTVPVAD
jgi:lactate racemase